MRFRIFSEVIEIIAIKFYIFLVLSCQIPTKSQIFFERHPKVALFFAVNVCRISSKIILKIFSS
jgi:hypothetical protein